MNWRDRYEKQIDAAIKGYLRGDTLTLEFLVEHIVRANPELTWEQVGKDIISIADDTEPVTMSEEQRIEQLLRMPSRRPDQEQELQRLLMSKPHVTGRIKMELELRAHLDQAGIDAQSLSMFGKPYKDLNDNEKGMLHSSVTKPITSVDEE